MTIYNKNQPESIKKMFGSIARKYDRANAILSLNMHKSWNRKLVHSMPAPSDEQILLDLCCGTGDIAFSYLSTAKALQQVIMVDFCQEMLDCAIEKAKVMKYDAHRLEFIQADVQSLPLRADCVTCATIAYGIRNVQDPLKCFNEVFRVMKPGGVFGILELTNPTNSIVKLGHSLYLKLILPWVGRWITSNRDAYEYLCDSIPRFVSTDSLQAMLLKAGFSSVKLTKMALGTATLLVAKKDSVQTPSKI